MQFQIVRAQFQQNYINLKKTFYQHFSILAKIQVLNNVLVIFSAM